MIKGFNNQTINKGRQKILDQAVKHGYDECLIKLLHDIDGTLADLNIIKNYIYPNRYNSDYTDQQLTDEIIRCIKLCIKAGHAERVSWLLPGYTPDLLLGESNRKIQILNIPETYELVCEDSHEDLQYIVFLKTVYQYKELAKEDIDLLYSAYREWNNKKTYTDAFLWNNEYLWCFLEGLPEIFIQDICNNKEQSLFYLAMKQSWYLDEKLLQFLSKQDIIADWVSKGEMENLGEYFTMVTDDNSKAFNENDFTDMLNKLSGKYQAAIWVQSLYDTSQDTINLNKEIDYEPYETVKNLFPDTDIQIPIKEPIENLFININNGYVNLYLHQYTHMLINHKGAIYPGESHFKVKLTMYPDFTLAHTLSKSGRTVPLSCKTIYSLAKQCQPFRQFITYYLEHMSETYPIAKDLLRELVDTDTEWILPISLQEILQYRNKKDLFTKRYKTAQDLRINYNKLSFSLSYIIIKTYPYLDTKSQEVLVNIRDESLVKGIAGGTIYGRKGYKKKIKNFISRYYSVRLHGEDNQIIIQDYIDMAFELKTKISLRYRSMKKLDDEHDRLAQEIMKKKYRKSTLKIPKDSKFNDLRKILPPEFEWIKSKARLFWEGKIQDHCVFAYIDKITKDQCAIYSYIDNTGEYTKIWKDKPVYYTIEFRYSPKYNKYSIRQVQGYKNCVNTEKMEEYIQSLLDKGNKALNSRMAG